MKRRTFTLAGFFGALGAAIGKALGYDVAPKPPVIDVYAKPARDIYAMRIGRQIHVLDSSFGDWRTIEAPLHEDLESTPRKAVMPEGVKHWSEAQDALKPEYAGLFQAKISELHTLLGKLENLTHSTPWETPAKEIRARIFELEQEIRQEITVRARMCDGHNGPGLLSKMIEMPDGRRLCTYCHKQETGNVVQLEGSDRGQASTV